MILPLAFLLSLIRMAGRVPATVSDFEICLACACVPRCALVINEMMTDEGEFVELLATEDANLKGWSLRGGIKFDFDAISLSKNEFLLIAREPHGLLAERVTVSCFISRDHHSALPISPACWHTRVHSQIHPDIPTLLGCDGRM